MVNSRPTNIVVVDDEEYICNIIIEALSSDSHNVVSFCDPAKALEHIENNAVDLVLTDLVMGEYTGVQVLESTLATHKDAIVLLMTAHPTVRTAISVLKKGAYDFLVKPFKLDILKATIDRGLEHQKVKRDVVNLKGQIEFLKVANASVAEENMTSFLKMVVESCKKELSAQAVSVTELDPDTQEIVTEVCDCEHEACLNMMADETERIEFTPGQSHPIIRHDEIEWEGQKSTKIFISQPVHIRGKLHGRIDVLIVRRFDDLTRGQMDVLTILSNAAASTIANRRLYSELQGSYLQAIRGLANAIEARDEYTAGHTDRVCRLATLIAKELGWNGPKLTALAMGCTLHDIGKIGVPDSILTKPAALSNAERERMQRHPEVGLKIISEIELFRPAVPYIMAHHEWYDGNGYPKKLAGEEIPIEGRLLAVADTFDAIMSDRPYREGRSFETAVSELVKYSGTQFDPKIVKAFFEVLRKGRVDFAEMYGHDEDLSVLDEVSQHEMAPA